METWSVIPFALIGPPFKYRDPKTLVIIPEFPTIIPVEFAPIFNVPIVLMLDTVKLFELIFVSAELTELKLFELMLLVLIFPCVYVIIPFLPTSIEVAVTGPIDNFPDDTVSIVDVFTGIIF